MLFGFYVALALCVVSIDAADPTTPATCTPVPELGKLRINNIGNDVMRCQFMGPFAPEACDVMTLNWDVDPIASAPAKLKDVNTINCGSKTTDVAVPNSVEDGWAYCFQTCLEFVDKWNCKSVGLMQHGNDPVNRKCRLTNCKGPITEDTESGKTTRYSSMNKYTAHRHFWWVNKPACLTSLETWQAPTAAPSTPPTEGSGQETGILGTYFDNGQIGKKLPSSTIVETYEDIDVQACAISCINNDKCAGVSWKIDGTCTHHSKFASGDLSNEQNTNSYRLKAVPDESPDPDPAPSPTPKPTNEAPTSGGSNPTAYPTRQPTLPPSPGSTPYPTVENDDGADNPTAAPTTGTTDGDEEDNSAMIIIIAGVLGVALVVIGVVVCCGGKKPQVEDYDTDDSDMESVASHRSHRSKRKHRRNHHRH